jgi:hypothetical protein
MKGLLISGLMLGLLALVVPMPAADTSDQAEAKEALKDLQDFIGVWKGSGGPDKPRPGPKEIWSETVNWSWRFKGDEAWLTFAIKDGKHLKSGEVRFLPEKKTYQLTTTTAEDKKLVFEGKLKNEALILERVDPDTRNTQQIKMNVAGDGVRFIYQVAHKAAGATIWKKDYLVACTKEGETLGAREKKNVCVVSGGLGTIVVSYKGETFYVCCSGCADAFKENPEKYIKEFKAKQGKK